MGGKTNVTVLAADNSLIKVGMGSASFDSGNIPVKCERREVIREPLMVDGEMLNCTCLTIGNPHCVVEMADLSKEAALKLGPLLENNPVFPNRTNVQFMKVIDRNNIQIEIWEGGAGYTLASGSSSCAAASAAFRLGLAENHINVRMPGGVIEIDISENGNVYMTGNVDSVFEGEPDTPAEREVAGAVSDAAYGVLIYDGEKPLSFLSVEGAMEVGVEIHSLSKAFNMIGWRMAFLAGNSKIISAYGTVKDKYV